jgi:hypothetical protein
MKSIKIVSAIFLSVVLLTSAIVYGETITKTIQVTYRNISILVNGKVVPSEQEPFIYQGRTFVPLRTIGEAVNKTVEWDNTKNQVNITDKPTESTQNFLSFPIHKMGERIEAYPYAITVNKITVLPQQRLGGNICIELILENISKKNLAFKDFSAFCLFDKNGYKYRFCNEVGLHTDKHYEATISFLAPGEIDSTANICFSNIPDYLNKSLVFVFEPKLIWLDLKYPPIEESNVFVAVDLGLIKQEQK